MEHHLDLSSAEFKAAFENCSLPAKLFTHEAHLRLAWLYLKEGGGNSSWEAWRSKRSTAKVISDRKGNIGNL